jgi:uncharacterized protein YcbX
LASRRVAGATVAQLSGLYVYPVKGCGGIALSEARVARRGLEHDRRWMIVDHEDRFLTQRELPELCHLGTALGPGGIEVADRRRPGEAPLRLPSAPDGPRRTVTVWRFTGPAVEHDMGSRWFSDALGRPCRAVFMPDDVARPTSSATTGEVVSFADGYPLLLVSEASLEDLNRRLPAPITMARFRPNLVVSGCAPFDEDAFGRYRIGEVAFRNERPCPRCAVTLVDPSTGTLGKEPLATLSTYRRQAREQSTGEVWFGMNVQHEAEGTLRVGDPVVLTGE